ncbi:MAG: FAD-dependent oxidoreductase [Peptococcaceae bacterium]|nr:FAD-dependent oxidoreductase [Peptococcaceae bacterium]NLM20739.1 FAD-dependent oxidoreductase [Peptococcaceae bacterium]
MAKFNEFQHVFSPIKVGNLTLKNRIQFSPMVCCLSNAAGEVTTEFVEFLGMQARTGAGLVTIGATPVDNDTGADAYGELDVTNDNKIPGLKRVSEEVHRYGAKLSIELVHSGRGSLPELLRKPYALAPSIIPTPGGPRKIKVMDQDDIDQVIKAYADCAERLVKADFDMAMIHAAHGNLIAQFLSPYTNKRNDYYGGSFENRARFGLELLQAVRERVGQSLALEMRISAEEMVEGGMELEETIEFIKLAQEYIDLVHVSVGLIVEHNKAAFWTMPPYYHAHCHNVKYAEAVKKDPDIKIPVTTVGSINTIKDAEEIIASGKADIVAMCRQLLADPETIKKAYRGEEGTTRPCLRCWEGCVGAVAFGGQVRCSINPVVGRETKYREIPLARRKKKVVVVGGGTAGMMATQTLVERGHEVVLMEKKDRLGGHLPEISALPFKGDLRAYLKWNVDTTMNCGAKILLNTEADEDSIRKENPDAIIIAVGSSPVELDIPGSDNENVHSVLDVDNGRVQVGSKVVVCGGGVSGMECALALAMEGKDVTVVDMIPVEQFAKDMVVATRPMLLYLLNQHKVKFIGEHKVLQFLKNGVEIEDRNWNHSIIEADTIVKAFGMRPNKELVERLGCIVPETYLVGDCDQAKNIQYANHSAFNVAVEV